MTTSATSGGAVDSSEPVPDYRALTRLDQRGVVVLGAGQGIGRQTCHALASLGATVCCVDIDQQLAERVAAEVGGFARVLDVTDRAAMGALFAEVDEPLRSRGADGLGGVVDIVGMAQYRHLVDVEDELWAWHQAIVLRHALLVVQLAGPLLARRGGGTMTFVSSVSAMSAAPLHAAYGAAKAGLVSLVRSAAVELGPQGVRVNSVAPGVVWTPRVSAYLGEAGRKRNEARAPLRRVATTADIAAAIVFLTSDLSGYVTGQTLVVDGGVSIDFPFPLPAEAEATAAVPLADRSLPRWSDA